MVFDERLDELLDEYEERRAKGDPVSPEELVRDDPHLLKALIRRIERLKAVDAFMGLAENVGASTDLPMGGDAPLAAGRYRPVQFHSKGALGEIIVARDEELDRDVALKRMTTHQARSTENRRRFEVEATITARLEHPGIVPVYGLGHDALGQPIYAMRFIKGETLSEAIESFHSGKNNAIQRENIGCQQLLRRFLSLCQTVAYAHSRGIVHRDIKPANVMLGEFGETLLVDWGLAKVIDRPDNDAWTDARAPRSLDGRAFEETALGVVKGSPAYMSPEQAEGRGDQVGPESDIYNLGATLYHMLAGQLPFDGDSHDVIRRVRQGSLVRPRVIKPDIPEALEAICMRAMNLVPNQRYASGLELANELERWLADEPVAAWSDPWTASMRRWLRRHRGTVKMATASLMLLLMVLVTATYLLTRKNTQLVLANQQTNGALTQVTEERAKAEDSLKAALVAVRTMLLRVGGVGVDQIPEMQSLRQEMLLDAVDVLKGFEGFEERPELQREQALAVQYLGKVQTLLGRTESAQQSYRKAIGLQETLTNQFPERAEYRHDLGVSWHDLGLLADTNVKQAEDALQRAVQLFHSLEEQLEGYKLPLADAYHNLGTLFTAINRPAKSLSCLNHAVQLREDLLHQSNDTKDADFQRLRLAACFHDIGQLKLIQDDEASANQWLQKARDILLSDPEDSLLRRSYKNSAYEVYNSMAVLATSAQDFDLAADQHKEALAIAKERANLYPNVPGYRDSIARTHHNLGNVYIHLQDKESAREQFESAVRIREPIVAEHPDDVTLRASLTESRGSLAHVTGWMGEHQQACLVYGEVVDELRELAREFPEVSRYQLSLCATEVNYGELLAKVGNIDASLATHGRTIERAQRILQENPDAAGFRRELFNAHGSRANTLISQQRFADAVADCDQVVDLSDETQRDLFRIWRAPILARVEHARADLDAQELLASQDRTPEQRYNLACTYSLASLTVLKDETIESPERNALAQMYRDAAFKVIESLQRQAFFETADYMDLLESDEDLSALREDPRWSTVVDTAEATDCDAADPEGC